jgi:hypothetical protein
MPEAPHKLACKMNGILVRARVFGERRVPYSSVVATSWRQAIDSETTELALW